MTIGTPAVTAATRPRSMGRLIALAALGLVVIVLGVGQLVLPGIAERRVREQLSPSGQVLSVQVSAFPAVELLWHRADRVVIRLGRYRPASLGGEGTTAAPILKAKSTRRALHLRHRRSGKVALGRSPRRRLLEVVGRFGHPTARRGHDAAPVASGEKPAAERPPGS